jgi:hypothetical protein
MPGHDASSFERLLRTRVEPAAERRGLARLMALLAGRGEPPDPLGLYPAYGELRERFVAAAAAGEEEALEESFLALYAHLHGYEVPATPGERRRMRASESYLNHVGGLSPILRAGPFIGAETVTADYGAGNGLQGLLLQHLHPHRLTRQIEISSRLVESGRALQAWLGIAKERVEWIVGDVAEISPAGVDFLYLYRPVRPSGEGRRFYESLAAELDDPGGPEVIFSVADCLGPFLSHRFEVCFSDGHLTCFRRVSPAPIPPRPGRR